MADVFISYPRPRARQAQQIADELRAAGYTVWRDDELPAHRAYSEVIRERLDQAKAVLVLWSAEAAGSEWVRSEANRAREGHKLVQARLDATPPPMPFDQIQCADLAGWRGRSDHPGWRKVVDSIAALIGETAAPDSRPATAAAPRWRGAMAAIAVAAIFALAAFLALDPLRAPADPGPALRTVAILPIRNLTGDPANDAAATQLTEDVIAVMGRTGFVSVTPRDVVFALERRAGDEKTLGAQLHVRNIVAASLRKAPPGYRVSMQIIDPTTGQVVGAQEVGAAPSDGAVPEGRLALSLWGPITGVVAQRWRDTELARPADDRSPDNLVARLYKLAEDDLVADIAAGERLIATAATVITKDSDLRPQFAMSVCEYYEDIINARRFGSEAQRDAWAKTGLDMAAEAASLKPHATAPHACRAAIFTALERWDEGMAEAQYIIDNIPLTAAGYSARAHLEFARGRFDDALSDFTELAARSDGDPVDMGVTQLFLGNYAAAITALRQGSVRDPKDPAAPFFLSAALQLSGKRDEAISAAASYRALKSDDSAWLNLVLSHEPAFLKRAAIVRSGLHDAGLEAPRA
jgi:adenylate cyclase